MYIKLIIQICNIFKDIIIINVEIWGGCGGYNRRPLYKLKK